MEEITISNYITGEETEIYNLVKFGFDEFVAVDCSEEGIKIFNDFIDPDEFRKRNQLTTFTLVAKNKDQGKEYFFQEKLYFFCNQR